MFGEKQKSLKVNAVLNGIKQSCSILFPLITFPYISRVLGSEGYGKYGFSFSITYYFILFAALGISTYAIREGAKIRDDQGQIDRFCSEVFSINVVSLLLSYILLILLIFLNPKIRSYSPYILIQSTAMIMATIGTDWINSIYEDYFYITARYIAVQFLALLAMFIFVRTPADLWKYCIIATLATNGGNLINTFYVRKRVHVRFVFHMNFRKHIVPLLILFVNSLAISVYVNSDVTMLGFFADDNIVGIYSFSSKIYNMLKQLVNAIIVVSIPRISYVLENKPELYKTYLQNVFNYLNIFLFPVVIGMLMMSRQIIYIAGGAQYLDGTVSLQILSLATIFAIYASLFTNCVLIVNRQENKCLQATIISAVINVGFNFILIPRVGMNGAAITTVIAEVVNCILQIYFSKKYYDYRELQLRPLLPSLLGSALIFVVCFIVKRMIASYVSCFAIAFIGSVVVYGTVMLIFNKDQFLGAFSRVWKK